MPTLSSLYDWLAGHLTRSERIWSALAPLIFIGGYMLIGFLVYLVKFGVHGGYQDKELQTRAGLASSRIAQFFVWVLSPVWNVVVLSGIPPHAVTTLSVLVATAAGVSLAAGRFALGGWLFVLSGVLDILDGRLARFLGRTSARGSALDSILDRYSDAVVIVGLAWYYRATWVLLPALVLLVGTLLVPYIRAKGEALAQKMNDVGAMQRPERIAILGACTALAPIPEALLWPTDPRPMHWLTVLAVVALAVATQFTALQRFVSLLGRLDGGAPAPQPERTEGTMWRALVSAFLATAADFGLVWLLVSQGWMSPALATATGCGLGAVINFSINRVWAFGSHDPTLPQGTRYALVSISSALLNSGGVAVFLMLPDLDYRIAWVVVRIAVFAAWNYPLHRDYVFATPPPPTSVAPAPDGVRAA
jgi:phosphatidylglycerophosphate synthase/putative flippase GtrA